MYKKFNTHEKLSSTEPIHAAIIVRTAVQSRVIYGNLILLHVFANNKHTAINDTSILLFTLSLTILVIIITITASSSKKKLQDYHHHHHHKESIDIKKSIQQCV